MNCPDCGKYARDHVDPKSRNIIWSCDCGFSAYGTLTGLTVVRRAKGYTGGWD